MLRSADWSDPALMPRPKSFEGFPDELRCEYGPYMAVIDGWHDGDTLSVVLDPGFDAHPCRWIRLLGTSTPELSEPLGHQLLEYVSTNFPSGTHCQIYTQKMVKTGGQVRSFERYVGEVIVLINGQRVSVNALINAYLLSVR
jgi:endonuclease YncB( thermonuclease family)